MSQEKYSLQINWKLLLRIVLAMGAVLLLTFASVFYSIIIINKDALKALVEAEATILGFFGLIVVYILKSFDDREDRCMQQRLDITLHSRQIVLHDLDELVIRIRKQRIRTIRYASVIGILLVFSMLLSIFTLGIMDIVLEVGFTNLFSQIIILLGLIGVFTFLFSIVELFRMFRDMAKMP